jgi:hypothetical protein
MCVRLFVCVCVCVVVGVVFMLIYMYANTCIIHSPPLPPVLLLLLCTIFHSFGGRGNTQLYRMGSFPEFFPVLNSRKSAAYQIFSPKSLELTFENLRLRRKQEVGYLYCRQLTLSVLMRDSYLVSFSLIF